MIISHKYKFIFVKTAKTAGTSIEVYLSQYCGAEDVLTPIWPHVEGHFARNYTGLWNPIPEIMADGGTDLKTTLRDLSRRARFYNHLSAKTIKTRVPASIWNSYFKFCVERNPWDKTLSHYHMVKDRTGGDLTFDQYLENGKFSINYPKYTDVHGNLLVDQVLKYESLNDELAAIFEQLGVPFTGSLGVRAKSKHRKDTRAYQEVYTDRQKALIDTIFAPEIKMHGYSFGE